MVDPISTYPISVEFRFRTARAYTMDGYYYDDVPMQSLFWDEVKFKAPTRPVPMKLINGVEVPDISFSPSSGEVCYTPFPIHSDLYMRIQFCSSGVDEHLVAHGLCYPFTEYGKKAAILHAKAMLGICNNNKE
jgi:hypothetical protein